MTLRLVTALVVALVASIGVGCQGQEWEVPRGDERAGGERSELGGPAERSRPAPRRRVPRCPSGSANCRRASGRVLYVEAVDPDGDGDAHLVLASRQSITAPGLTIVDVGARLRPARLPQPGDWVGAAGPVFPGSREQRQIEARKLRVSRLRR